jgi:hypothetical protein
MALIAVLAMAMTATAMFGYSKFADEVSDLVQSRYSFVAFTIKKKVEDSLNLGLALRQLRQIQATIELEKARDEQIQGIQIFDAKGEVLFNTDRGQVGAAVPESWLAPLNSGNQPFSLMDEDSNVVALPLVNNLGKVEGAVALLFPTGYVERELGESLLTLLMKTVACFAVFALAALIAAHAALGGVRKRLTSMETALSSAIAVDQGDAIVQTEEFDGQFDEFVAKTTEAVGHIRDSVDEVERLDRLA